MPKMYAEPRITINGVVLNDAQAATVRVAVAQWLTELHEDKKYMKELGEIGPMYQKRLGEVQEMMFSETNKLKKECIGLIKDGLGINVTFEQLDELLAMNTSLYSDIEKWGVNDTEVRGKLCSALSKKLIKKPVPTFGDGEAAGIQFFRDLHEAARKAGYRVEEQR